MSLELKGYQKEALATLREFLRAARGGGDAVAAAYRAALSAQNRPEAPYRAGGFGATPCVCIRIPTGGGKTLLGAHAIPAAARDWRDSDHPLTLWLTPSDTICRQTVAALKDPAHPCRQALEARYPQRVRAIELHEFGRIRPHDLKHSAIVAVATLQSFRVEEMTQRNVYAFDEAYQDHFADLSEAQAAGLLRVEAADLQRHPYLQRGDLGRVKWSLANLLRLHRPIVIVDEAHNANTPLSLDTLERVRPACIIELTATPAPGSNVLYRVSAQELRAEQMIKLPILLSEHVDGWEVCLHNAVLTRKLLEAQALREEVDGGDYIRPITLYQAEDDNGKATVARLKAHLIEQEKIKPGEIAVATGTERGIAGVDLADRNCPIRHIITKKALEEGWDCPFAYVFCSVRKVQTPRAAEQILGRVLRMPYASERRAPELNRAYAHISEPNFGAAARALADGLVEMGFEKLEAESYLLPQAQRGLFDKRPEALPDIGQPAPFVCTLKRAPDLAALPEESRQRIVVASREGGGSVVEVSGELDPPLEAALLHAANGKREEGRIREEIDRYRIRWRALQSPSLRGERFAPLPRLCLWVQGELVLADREAFLELGQWTLADGEIALPGFEIVESARPFEIGIREDGGGVYCDKGARQSMNLDLVSTDVEEGELVRWLDCEVHQIDVMQPDMRSFLALTVRHLIRERGFTLTQLTRARFQLARALVTRIEWLRQQANRHSVQKQLFESDAVVTSDAHPFEFKPDNYPARPPFYSGRYRFQKHYYPHIGDLKESGEEFDCAVEIDRHPQMRHWARNLERCPDHSFWLPTETDRFYPDFVCELRDGRSLVVEYKGQPYASNDDSVEKRQIGNLWADGHPRCLFLMAEKRDTRGRTVRQQLDAAIC